MTKWYEDTSQVENVRHAVDLERKRLRENPPCPACGDEAMRFWFGVCEDCAIASGRLCPDCKVPLFEAVVIRPTPKGNVRYVNMLCERCDYRIVDEEGGEE